MNVAPRTAARAAYLAAALNLLAALAMLLILRLGLPAPGSQLEDRAAYLTTHLHAWWGAWLLWHAAAIALLAFYVVLAGQWWRAAPLRCVLALLCTATGLAADLSAEALYMGLAPTLSPPALVTLETAAGLLTGYVANGLYTVAGALLTWAGAHALPRLLVLLSLPVWAAGAALSAATLAQSLQGQFWSTAILMPAFVLWAALIGRWLSHQARRAS
jgi:hypothetical protein